MTIYDPPPAAAELSICKAALFHVSWELWSSAC